MNRKRLTALLLSAALIMTNTLPVQAEITVIDVTDQLQESYEEVSENDMNRDDVLPDEDETEQDADAPDQDFADQEECAALEESEEDLSSETSSAYPAKFDPRPDGVSTVRHQVGGSCWAFAAMAAIESNLIKKGLADTSVDLSEFQMVYFMDHNYDDPLGNYISEDDTTRTNRELLDNGGEAERAFDFLSRWTGPVDESRAPLGYYEDAIMGTYWERYDWDTINAMKLDKSLASSEYHLRETRHLKYDRHDSNNIDAVKSLITAYGGVCGDYFDGGLSYYKELENGDRSYHSPKNNGFVFDNGYYSPHPNHAVEFIGWDDDFPASDFKYSPGKNGAWLVKCSNMGYFWLSYYDADIENIDAVEFDSASVYENMYAYGERYSGAATSQGYAMNIFEAKAYGAGNAEKIDGVMAKFDDNTSYELTIYLNPVVENGKLVSWSGKSKTVTGMSDFEGYYTIDLSDQNIYVADGSTYGICMKTSQDGKKGGLIYSTGRNRYPEGIMYEGDSLDELCTPKYSVPCLRGLANKADVVLCDSISLNTDSVLLKEGESTVAAVKEILPANATNKTYTYRSTDESVAAVDQSGKITAAGYGECDIIVTTYDGKSDTCHVNVSCSGFSLPDLQMTAGETVSLAPVYPNGCTGIKNSRFTWTSSDPDVLFVDADGKVTAKNAGTVTVNASIRDSILTGDRLLTASCRITITKLMESIITDTNNMEVYEGESGQMIYSVLPDDTTNKAVSFSSSSAAVSIDQSGKFTAVSAGTAVITITALDGSGISKEVAVTVKTKSQPGNNTSGVQSGTKKDTTNNKALQKNLLYRYGNGYYRVLNADRAQVCFYRPKSVKKTVAVIPDTVMINGVKCKVTSISDGAFKNNKKLKSVVIGKNITQIGKEAYSGCKSIKSVTIKTSKLKKVGKKAFIGIDKSAVIKVPEKKLKAYTKLLKGKYTKGVKIAK